MRFHGRLHKDGRFWLAEVPLFGAMTQGRTRKEALDMIADWFETMVDDPAFSVTAQLRRGGEFEISSSDTRLAISFLLRRKRQMSGLSLTEVAERLGERSRNAYARYERGSSVPTVEKLEKLLRAVSPNEDLVVDKIGAA